MSCYFPTFFSVFRLANVGKHVIYVSDVGLLSSECLYSELAIGSDESMGCNRQTDKQETTKVDISLAREGQQ